MPARSAYARGVTFRDDHAAALARADALEVELEQLRRERAALAAERDQAVAERDRAVAAASTATTAAPKPSRGRRGAKAAPAGAPAAARRGSVWGTVALVVGGVAIAGAFVGSAASDGCARRRAHDRWRAATAARTSHQQRWRALVDVEPCLRKAALDAVAVEHLAPERYDPRTQPFPGWSFDQLAGNCTGGAAALVADAATAPAVRAELREWLDVEAALAPIATALTQYYHGRDWVEDDLRGARWLWTDARALIACRRAVIAQKTSMRRTICASRGMAPPSSPSG